jgi:uncharacterized protein (DUF433 family)
MERRSDAHAWESPGVTLLAKSSLRALRTPSARSMIRQRRSERRDSAGDEVNATARKILETPSYAVAEVAGFLFLPSSTLRSWVSGRTYPTKEGARRFRALIHAPESNPTTLSFINVVEAHVLSAIRRTHHIPVLKVRRALDYVERRFRVARPLADREFLTDGIDLFVEGLGGELEVASEAGQLGIRDLIAAHLRRIDRDPRGVPIRLYPFTRYREIEEPRPVTIDPRVAFGRPVLTGTGIPTEVVAERFNAGESIHELADDYGRRREEIEEAIRFERHVEAA